jgi:hypothetical protein
MFPLLHNKLVDIIDKQIGQKTLQESKLECASPSDMEISGEHTARLKLMSDFHSLNVKNVKQYPMLVSDEQLCQRSKASDGTGEGSLASKLNACYAE